MDKIAEELGLQPLTNETPFDKQLVIVHHKSDERNVDDDFIQARESLKTLITSGTEMIKDLAYLAKQSESARTYEVLTTYMKTMADLNVSLMDVHKKRKDILDKKVQTEELANTKFAYIGTIEDINYE